MLAFLLSLATEGEREKIEYLYNKYHNDMIRFARHRLKRFKALSSKSDAEDIVQNAFVKIVKYIDAIDLSRPEKQLKAYIFSIVVNETKNFIADNTAYSDIDTYSDVLTDEHFFDKLQIEIRYNSVVEAIKQLDEKYSITLLLYYCEDMDVKMISETLGIAEKTVYTRLERGKRLVLEALSKEGLS